MTHPRQHSDPSGGSLRRTAIGLVALAGLWNAVYWLWPANREPPVVVEVVQEASPADRTVEAPAEPDSDVLEPVVMTMGSAETSEEAQPQIIDPILHDPAEQLALVAPAFRDYEVTAGDRTLGDIAERFYGDSALHGVIARANPYKDPRRLAEGQVWRVPLDPDNIQGLVVDGEGREVDASPASTKSDAYDTYVVRANDTFGAISRRFYDTTRHAQFLYEHNRERLGLRSIRSLRPGQVLHIPSEPK